MKHKVLTLAVALAAFASVASADTLVLGTNSYSNGSNGGSYTASGFGTSLSVSSYSSLVSSTLLGGSFETFCLEPTEYFTPGNSYTFTQASFAFGGAGNTHGAALGGGDPLSIGTAWLYSQFAAGTLANFDYSNTGHKGSNLLLQRAIWYLEDDYSGYLNATAAINGNIFLKNVCIFFGTLGAGQANAAPGSYGVSALNLTTGQTQNQSQLYYHVPEAGSTIALLGLASLGLLAFRRRFSK
jgi:hypothetical protein